MSQVTPTLLLILDGWGRAPAGPGNAVSLADPQNLNRIQKDNPGTHIKCAGRAVGLPDGFMGNSEVGHMNIGAGRVVYQDMTRIDIAIEENKLPENAALLDLMGKVKNNGAKLHLMGLVSDGGVHSHQNHIYALLALAKEQGVEVVVHAFLDGRDTPPTSGKGYVQALADKMNELGSGKIATIMGRYYAMDRDKRWERNQIAYDGMTRGVGEEHTDPAAAVQAAYDVGEEDEFVKPRIMMDGEKPVALLEDGDGVFFFNFRADRARQIVRSLFDQNFSDFERAAFPKLDVATMTQYESTFGLPAAFPPQSIAKCLGEVVSGMGLKQLRIAETEKYAHVTYFLNGGREEPFDGEDRKLIPSPRDVATYDLKPEMSVQEVTAQLLELWSSGAYDLVVCNLANLDMVGHTGVIDAVIQAVHAVDDCVGSIEAAVRERGGVMLLTADHGNAEEMLDENGGKQTAHSKNEVNLVLVNGPQGATLADGGKLGDIAPTILALWDEKQPEEMTGQSLLQR